MQTSVVTQSSSTAAASAAAKTGMGQDTFLKLLVAQLQNQDPTNAQDPNQMVQQMATFSSLEAQIKANSLLTNIQAQNTATYQAASTGLIGKKVMIATSQIDLSGGNATFGVHADADATMTMTIKDQYGRVVREIGPGFAKAGDASFHWDGRDADGNQLADGTYTATLSARGAANRPVNAYVTTAAVITSISYESDGSVMVTAGGKKYSLDNVTQIAG